MACEALNDKKADVVLGPTTDGGYYLFGLNKPVAVFHGVAWSTATTFEKTVQNISDLKLRLLKLPEWYDVDTFSDFLRLRDELISDEQVRTRAPATYRWLLEYDFISSAS